MKTIFVTILGTAQWGASFIMHLCKCAVKNTNKIAPAMKINFSRSNRKPRRQLPAYGRCEEAAEKLLQDRRSATAPKPQQQPSAHTDLKQSPYNWIGGIFTSYSKLHIQTQQKNYFSLFKSTDILPLSEGGS